MANPRITETREAATRVNTTWRPANSLPDPLPQPGWSFRWIRTSVMNNPDPRNVSTAQREGWVPVRMEDHPEMQLDFDSRSSGAPSGNVEIGGLILCKMPTEMVESRTAYFADATHKQTQSVDYNVMRENDARMPLFSEKNSSVSFGRGS